MQLQYTSYLPPTKTQRSTAIDNPQLVCDSCRSLEDENATEVAIAQVGALRELTTVLRQLRDVPSDRDLVFGFKAVNSPTPGGVLACRESYQVYSRHYQLSSFGKLGRDHEIWFDFQRDTLFLDWEFGILHKEGWYGLNELGRDTERVTRLAICDRKPALCYDPRVSTLDDGDSALVVKMLDHFGPDLEKLTLVMEDYMSLGSELASASFCDINTLLKEYSLPYDPIRDQSIQQFIKSYDKGVRSILWHDDFVLGSNTAVTGIWWPVPDHDRKVFVKKRILEEFNTAKDRYYKEKTAHAVSCTDEACRDLHPGLFYSVVLDKMMLHTRD